MNHISAWWLFFFYLWPCKVPGSQRNPQQPHWGRGHERECWGSCKHLRDREKKKGEEEIEVWVNMTADCFNKSISAVYEKTSSVTTLASKLLFMFLHPSCTPSFNLLLVSPDWLVSEAIDSKFYSQEPIHSLSFNKDFSFNLEPHSYLWQLWLTCWSLAPWSCKLAVNKHRLKCKLFPVN